MTNVEQQIATSVLVIGTGGSGLRAAIELAERGIDVLIVGKRPKTDAHTTLAAGGINAALATMDADDTWQQHAADTLTESYLLADPMTVQVVTEGAAESIRDLERYGMAFAREQDGRISQRFFGAHTFRRTAFAGDYTGLELQRALIRRTAQLAIPILDSTYITKLLVRDNVIFGAYGFNLQDGTRYTIAPMPSSSPRVDTLGSGDAHRHVATKIRVTLSVWRSRRAGGSAIPSLSSSIRPG